MGSKQTESGRLAHTPAYVVMTCGYENISYFAENLFGGNLYIENRADVFLEGGQ